MWTAFCARAQERRMDELQTAFSGTHVCDVAEEEDSQNRIRDHLNPGVRSTAYVSIMQGCEMKCAYCIVPYTRGAERSRPIRDVVDEVKMLADAGVKEVTLLGQIVNRYGRQMETAGGKGGFVQLLEAVHEVEGIRRIRFVSPHPIGFRQDLVQAFTYLPKLCSHIHFPMQSGSDRILKMMRRPYRNETYLDLCSLMKQARPDLSITTDIIVGFPGETEEDYLLTRQAVEQVQFDNAFIFRYSPRRGTPAAVMENQIPEEVKEARNQDLLAVVNEIAIRKNRDLVGTVQEVLLEGPSKTNAARLSGRTSQNKPVRWRPPLTWRERSFPSALRKARDLLCTAFHAPPGDDLHALFFHPQIEGSGFPETVYGCSLRYGAFMLRRENDCAGACGPDPRRAVHRVARMMPDEQYVRPRCFLRTRQGRKPGIPYHQEPPPAAFP